MSDEGEKTCPLCAEEMDLTDQQLKPCKCGYEVCTFVAIHLYLISERLLVGCQMGYQKFLRNVDYLCVTELSIALTFWS